MITIREYARPATLEEAWQLNQKRPNRVLGGMLWLKMEKSALAQSLTYLRWGWIPLKKPIPNLPLAPWQRCAAWKPTPR